MVQSSVDFASFKFIRLNPEDAVKSFDCGDADLNDFILNHAREFQKFLLAVSYACVNSQTGKVYAYCSLANDKVAITDFKDKTEFNRFRKKRGFPNEKRLKSYPAVKLCRLGVDVDAKGQRIGSTIDQNVFTLDNAFQRRWEMKQISNKLKNDNEHPDEKAQYNQPIGDTGVTWGKFREEINKIIMLSAEENGLSSMEDKRLGGWFITPKNEPDAPEGTEPKITKKAFAEKVLKYLWDDAFKFDRKNHFGSVKTLEDLVENFEKDGFKVFVEKAEEIAKLQSDTPPEPPVGERPHTESTAPTPDPDAPAAV